MLKQYINKLIKQGIIGSCTLLDPESRYNIIMKYVAKKHPHLALFYLNALYEKHIKLNSILMSFKMYQKIKKHNIKIDIGKFRLYPFRIFYDKLTELYNTISVPNFILNDIKEFKNILHDSEYTIIACLKLKDNEYVDDFRTMKYFSSYWWCIKREENFSTYTTKRNSIQYILIKKVIFEDYKQENKLSNLAKHNIISRIGITLKRTKKFSFFNRNMHLICHDERNNQIIKLSDFNEVTNYFPINKIHNKLIKIIKNKYILDLPKNQELDNEEDTFPFYVLKFT